MNVDKLMNWIIWGNPEGTLDTRMAKAYKEHEEKDPEEIEQAIKEHLADEQERIADEQERIADEIISQRKLDSWYTSEGLNSNIPHGYDNEGNYNPHDF